jgi:hypothetical protein
LNNYIPKPEPGSEQSSAAVTYRKNYLIFCLNKKPFSLNPMAINNWFPSSCLGIIAFKTSSNIKQLHSQARAWKRILTATIYS